MTRMFCLRCKSHTPSYGIKRKRTKNGKFYLSAHCGICSRKKARFLKQAQRGGGVLNSLINKLPLELHLPGHNFTGPGTKLRKRLDANDQPHQWSQPVNRIDRAAMKHDICYRENKNPRVRRELCDWQMLDEMANIPNPTLREILDRKLAGGMIAAKVKLGMWERKKWPTLGECSAEVMECWLRNGEKRGMGKNNNKKPTPWQTK